MLSAHNDRVFFLKDKRNKHLGLFHVFSIGFAEVLNIFMFFFAGSNYQKYGDNGGEQYANPGYIFQQESRRDERDSQTMPRVANT
jgi:hypothetical protein